MADEKDNLVADRLWAAVAILGAVAVAFMAFDLFSQGQLSGWLGERLGPRFAGLSLVQNTEAENDDDAA